MKKKIKELFGGKKFQRKIEDFDCENCGESIKGDGYTNHCPSCLWSKHVDNHPGDRSNSCKGLMEPVDAYFEKGMWHVVHKCVECGEEKNIKISESESLDAISDIIQKKTK